jgi:outer membrane protein assembly factor BamB
MVKKDRIRNLRFIMGILLILLLLPSAVSASDWARFQKDNYNSGVTSDKTPITNPVGNNISWENDYSSTSPSTWTGIDNVPVVVDDIVYALSDDGKLRALYKVNGTEKWACSAGAAGFTLGNMVAGDGYIFIPTNNGKVKCVNMTSGILEWSKSLSSKQIDTPAVYSDDKVYVGEAMGGYKYYCLDAETGDKIWNRTSTLSGGQGAYYWAGAAVIGENLVYGDDYGYLVSVNKDNGTTIQELNVSSEFGVDATLIRSSVLYVEELERVYFTSRVGYCYSLGFNQSTGTFDTSDTHIASIGYCTSTPAYYNGKIYVGGGSSLRCLDASDLTSDWGFSANGRIQSSPAISTAYDDGDGEIYIYFTTNTGTGKVYCVNESGSEQWSWGTSSKTAYTLCGVAISDGWIFYGTDKDYVFGFATEESVAEEPNIIEIDDTMDLQEVIYAAENGDTVMMAPGTYIIETWDNNLNINKSSLTLMVDGGEVIITPSASVTDSYIYIGRENSSTTVGCDASGTTFKGITFDGITRIAYETTPVPDQDMSYMRYEECTFNHSTVTLSHNGVMKNCVLNNPDFDVFLYGDNIVMEGNVGITDVRGGWYLDSGSTIYTNNITVRDNILNVGYWSLKYADFLVENNTVNSTASMNIYDIENSFENTIINNTFVGEGSMRFEGLIYGNDLTYIGSSTLRYFRCEEGGTCYLNNIKGYSKAKTKLYPANYSTPAPVTYTYGGASHTGYLGNYYSSYTGIDADANGVGDSDMTGGSYGGIDEYPLVGVWDAATSTIEAEGLTFIDNSSSLQETIYAANDGDTIMMAPGTYVIDSNLYINKSGLIFMPDGGEAIITPNASAGDVDILYGVANASDTTGCDASGIAFKDITFGAFKHIGQEWDDTLWVPNLQDSNISYEGCTFNDVYKIYMKHNAVLKDSTLEATSYFYVTVIGDNVLIENNEGNAKFKTSNILTSAVTSVPPVNFTFRNNIVEGGSLTNKYADSLIENNYINTTSSIYVYDTDSIVRNNTFISGSYMKFEGQVYENSFTDGTAGASGKYITFYEGGTYYLNNIIGYPTVNLESANYRTSSQVTYTYDGTSYTGYLGNYYSDYAGNDTDTNGVGEDAYSLDFYPLMGTWNAATSTIGGESGATEPSSPVATMQSVGDLYTYINWTEPADNGSPITGYNIYRSTTSGSETLYDTVDASATRYTDHNVSNGQDYYYQVSAVNAIVEGALSTEISATPMAATSDDVWRQFMSDVQHTGYTASAGPKTNVTLWESSDIDAEDGASVVIADDLGLLFVIGDYKESSWATDGYNNLTALNINDGSVVWDVTFGSGSNYNSYDSWATPAYHDGVVFTSGDGARYANNGTLKWGSMPINTNGGPLVVEGKVIIGNWDGEQYFCLDEETGAVLWNISVNGNAQGTPAYNDSHIFLTSYDEVNCVDMDGNELWNRTIDNVMGSATLKYGLVYITTYDMNWGTQYVYALNEDTGDIVWQSSMDGQMIGTDCTPAVAYGYVYVTAGMDMIDQHTFCFDAFTGDVVWTSDEAGSWFTSPVVSDGVVYAGAESYFTGSGGMGSFTHIAALDAFTGNLIWESEEGGSTPAIYNGVLYTVGFQQVYAYSEQQPAPVADFKADTIFGTSPLIVQFTDLSSDAVSWSWDFDSDGTEDSTDQNPSYTYSAAGNYTVSLTVSNSAGSDTVTEFSYITVNNAILYIDDTMDLQETIYAANDGDTIMMTPGTYNVLLVDGSVDLYINKSDLTFMADGGEVIIRPEDGDSSPYICPGKADANDVAGCDASGITFNGITLESFQIGEYDSSLYPSNTDFSDISFIGCTFTSTKTSATYYYLQDNSSVVNCTFPSYYITYMMGDDSRFEGNTGTGGVYSEYGTSGFVMRNNSLASSFISTLSASALIENNVIEAPKSFDIYGLGQGVIIRNNEFRNASTTILMDGDIHLNTFTNCVRVYLGENGAGYIYLNNFIDCPTIRLYSPGVYNTPSQVNYTYAGQEYTGYLGNYYSSYTGIDSNGDGVGDDSLTLYKDTDSYPLMGTWTDGEVTLELKTLYDDTVYLMETDVSVEAINSGSSYDVSERSDLGALLASGLNCSISDKWYAGYGSFYLVGIEGIEEKTWPGAGWGIYTNDVAADYGLGLNDVEDGDVISFYYAPYDSSNNEQLLEDATYVVHITVSDETPVEVVRTITTQTFNTGGDHLNTTTVTVTLTATRDIESLNLIETVPSGWDFTISEKDGAEFREEPDLEDSYEWVWACSLSAGESCTVEYLLEFPADTALGTYELSGVASTYVDGVDVNDINVLGDSTIILEDDWNPWDDIGSDSDAAVTTAELKSAISLWCNVIPSPDTGAIITTDRLQYIIHQWLES